MKSEFVAGDIQKIFNVDKTRYAYVMRQVGIKPETEVIGTGRSHQYSFKNVLQFAFANTALGFLSARVCKEMLEYIESKYSTIAPNLFKHESTKAFLYYAQAFDDVFGFYFETDKKSEMVDVKNWGESKWKSMAKVLATFEPSLRHEVVKQYFEIEETVDFDLSLILERNPSKISDKDTAKVVKQRERVVEKMHEELSKTTHFITEKSYQSQHYMLNLGGIKEHVMKGIRYLE